MKLLKKAVSLLSALALLCALTPVALAATHTVARPSIDAGDGINAASLSIASSVNTGDTLVVSFEPLPDYTLPNSITYTMVGTPETDPPTTAPLTDGKYTIRNVTGNIAFPDGFVGVPIEYKVDTPNAGLGIESVAISANNATVVKGVVITVVAKANYALPKKITYIQGTTPKEASLIPASGTYTLSGITGDILFPTAIAGVKVHTITLGGFDAATITNLSASKTTVRDDDDPNSVTITATPKAGFTLPDSISYTMGGTSDSLQLNKDKNTNTYTILKVTGDVTLSEIKGVATTFTVTNYAVDTASIEANSLQITPGTTVAAGGTITVTATPKAGFTLAPTLSYTMGGGASQTVNLAGTSYTIPVVTGNVILSQIKGVATVQSYSVTLGNPATGTGALVRAANDYATPSTGIPHNSTVVVRYEVQAGYTLPATIEYTMAGRGTLSASLQNGSYTISNVVGNITLNTLVGSLPLTITYLPGATTGITGMPTPSTITVNGGSTFTAARAPSRTNYSFDGWLASWNNGNIPAGTIATAPATGTNLTLTAQWKVEPTPSPTPSPTPTPTGTKFSLQASASEGGTIAPTGSVSVNREASQTYRFTANRGYKLKAVYIDGKTTPIADGSYTFMRISADHTIFALYEKTTPGYDDVPKTGDITPLLVCVGLVPLLGYGGYLLKKRLRR